MYQRYPQQPVGGGRQPIGGQPIRGQNAGGQGGLDPNAILGALGVGSFQDLLGQAQTAMGADQARALQAYKDQVINSLGGGSTAANQLIADFMRGQEGQRASNTLGLFGQTFGPSAGYAGQQLQGQQQQGLNQQQNEWTAQQQELQNQWLAQQQELQNQWLAQQNQQQNQMQYGGGQTAGDISNMLNAPFNFGGLSPTGTLGTGNALGGLVSAGSGSGSAGGIGSLGGGYPSTYGGGGIPPTGGVSPNRGSDPWRTGGLAPPQTRANAWQENLNRIGMRGRSNV